MLLASLAPSTGIAGPEPQTEICKGSFLSQWNWSRKMGEHRELGSTWEAQACDGASCFCSNLKLGLNRWKPKCCSHGLQRNQLMSDLLHIILTSDIAAAGKPHLIHGHNRRCAFLAYQFFYFKFQRLDSFGSEHAVKDITVTNRRTVKPNGQQCLLWNNIGSRSNSCYMVLRGHSPFSVSWHACRAGPLQLLLCHTLQEPSLHLQSVLHPPCVCVCVCGGVT